jgi:hypothetical protein
MSRLAAFGLVATDRTLGSEDMRKTMASSLEQYGQLHFFEVFCFRRSIGYPRPAEKMSPFVDKGFGNTVSIPKS